MSRIEGTVYFAKIGAFSTNYFEEFIYMFSMSDQVYICLLDNPPTRS